MALIHSDLTKEQTNRKSTYYYEFDHKPERPSPTDAGPDWLKTSASHTDELQFIFSLLVRLYVNSDGMSYNYC